MTEQAVKVIQYFVTEDGVRHDSYEEAMAHHRASLCAEAVDSWVQQYIGTEAASFAGDEQGTELVNRVLATVVKSINGHWQELHDVLSKRLAQSVASGTVPETLHVELDKPLTLLGLKERTVRLLQDGGYYQVGQVVGANPTQLLALKGFGKARLNALNEALHCRGLEVGLDTSGWSGGRVASDDTSGVDPEDSGIDG